MLVGELFFSFTNVFYYVLFHAWYFIVRLDSFLNVQITKAITVFFLTLQLLLAISSILSADHHHYNPPFYRTLIPLLSIWTKRSHKHISSQFCIMLRTTFYSFGEHM